MLPKDAASSLQRAVYMLEGVVDRPPVAAGLCDACYNMPKNRVLLRQLRVNDGFSTEQKEGGQRPYNDAEDGL